MADSYYCKLCKGRCDNCTTCLRTPGRVQLKPSTDMIKLTTGMIKTALENKGAFTSSAFQTISKEPPKISVEASADGGVEVAVTLTSMPFISAYRDARSMERRVLENAAREEIIRSFELPRHRVGDGDIKVDITEGSVRIQIAIVRALVAMANYTILALGSATNANRSNILTTWRIATATIIGVAAGAAVFGPVGVGVGAFVGFIGGSLL